MNLAALLIVMRHCASAGPTRRRFPVFLGAVLLAGGAQSFAATYTMTNAVVAAGGGSLQAGGYRLDATLGQAAVATSSGGSYHLYGGFWAPASDVIFASDFDQ